MDQKTQRSRVFPPTLCHGVARIFLTAPLSYDAVALHRGQCEQLLRYVKLATSSLGSVGRRGLDRAPNGSRRSGRRFGQRLCVDGAEASPGFVPSAAATSDVWGAVLPSSAGGHRVGVLIVPHYSMSPKSLNLLKRGHENASPGTRAHPLLAS